MSLAKNLRAIAERAKADLEKARKADQERMFEQATSEVKKHLPMLEKHMMQAASQGKHSISLSVNNIDTTNMSQFFKQETGVTISIQGDQIFLDWSN